MNAKNSEIFPELILPLGSIALKDFLASGDSLVSEDFLASGDSLVSEDFLASENNFTSEYSLAPQEIDVDPLTGMAKNFTVNRPAEDEYSIRNLKVKSIRCIKANADTPSWANDDDIYITINNEKIWGVNAMDDRETGWINKSRQYTAYTTISVWDEDPGRDDLIGTIAVNGYYNGPGKLVAGNGSQYIVYFTST